MKSVHEYMLLLWNKIDKQYKRMYVPEFSNIKQYNKKHQCKSQYFGLKMCTPDSLNSLSCKKRLLLPEKSTYNYCACIVRKYLQQLMISTLFLCTVIYNYPHTVAVTFLHLVSNFVYAKLFFFYLTNPNETLRQDSLSICKLQFFNECLNCLHVCTVYKMMVTAFCQNLSSYITNRL